MGRNHKAGVTTLTVRTSAGEGLDHEQAQWLAMGQSYMLPFRFEPDGAKTLLYYDITGADALDDVLHAPLDDGRYMGMLVAVLSVMEQCAARGIGVDRVIWDTRHIYIAPQLGYPQFVLIPVIGVRPGKDTPATLLTLLADARRVRLATQSGQYWQRMLLGFLRQCPAFGMAQLHDFLSGMVPDIVRPRQRAGANQRTAGSHVVDADPYGETVASMPAAGNGPIGRGFGDDGVAGDDADDDTDEGTVLSGRSAASAMSASSPTPRETPNPSSDAEADGTVLSRYGLHENGLQGNGSSAGDAPVADEPSIGERETIRAVERESAERGHSVPPVQPALPVRPESSVQSTFAADSAPSVGPMPSTDSTPSVEPVPAKPVPPIGAVTPANPASSVKPAPFVHSRPSAEPTPRAKSASSAGAAAVAGSASSASSAASALATDDEGETMLYGMRAARGYTVRRLRDGYTVCSDLRQATIGRSKTADIHMGGNTNVSRIHARIDVLADGRFAITDNHSANGTEVGGRPLASGGMEYLESGDDFTLADDTFVITKA